MKENEVVVVSLEQLEAMFKKYLGKVQKEGSPKSLEDSLTQTQAAKFLGVVPLTIIRWRKEGKVPFYQVGRKIYYDKQELIDIAQNNPKLLRATG